MTATDDLRKLLDEHGVEHEDKHTELVPDIDGWDSTWWQGIAGMTFLAVGDEKHGREGCVYINGTYLTPEQAITATLGSGTCEYAIKDNMNETEGMGDVWIECSACHCTFDYYADEWLMNMHYCPNCGAKVVGE